MSRVSVSVNTKVEGRNIEIGIAGIDTVTEALGSLGSKTPAALKVAVNATARQARKLMIARAKVRYAVNAAGRKHLNDLRQNRKATNKSPTAQLHISKMRNDLGYFQHSPAEAYTGLDVFRSSPQFYKAKVLKAHSMAPLTGGGNMSKGFLIHFHNAGGNDHIGMVQRIIGSHSSHTVTKRGKPRWRNAKGQVEKLQTMGSPSASAMHKTIWPEVQDDVELYLMARLDDQVDRILARAKARRT